MPPRQNADFVVGSTAAACTGGCPDVTVPSLWVQPMLSTKESSQSQDNEWEATGAHPSALNCTGESANLVSHAVDLKPWTSPRTPMTEALEPVAPGLIADTCAAQAAGTTLHGGTLRQGALPNGPVSSCMVPAAVTPGSAVLAGSMPAVQMMGHAVAGRAAGLLPPGSVCGAALIGGFHGCPIRHDFAQEEQTSVALPDAAALNILWAGHATHERQASADVGLAREFVPLMKEPTACTGYDASGYESHPQVRATQVVVWRCKHAHGLFSMMSLALGHAERCEKNGWGLIVDWSSPELLYRGPPGEPNLWTAFFKQPAELTIQPEVLLQTLRDGRYMETEKNNTVFGQYRGVIQEYGTIPDQQAARGRALCKRNVVPRERFLQRLRAVQEKLLPDTHRWLAVHIRRGDKACEAKANFELSNEDIFLRIGMQCHAWNCNGVFLCSDDAGLKKKLEVQLSTSVRSGGYGFAVSSYPSTLPTIAGQAAHFDKSIDHYQKAEDVVFETFLMARACHGLLSTFSNVSASVVYLSPSTYPYATFWDPVDYCTPLQRDGLFKTCAAEAAFPEKGMYSTTFLA